MAGDSTPPRLQWWPTPDRDGRWGMTQIAEAAGRKESTVSTSWRHEQLATLRTVAQARGWSLNEAQLRLAGQQLQPGQMPLPDSYGDWPRADSPRWEPETIIDWLVNDGLVHPRTHQPQSLRLGGARPGAGNPASARTVAGQRRGPDGKWAPGGKPRIHEHGPGQPMTEP